MHDWRRGIINGNVVDGISPTTGTPNVTNGGTINGTLVIAPPVSGPAYIFGSNSLAGYAAVNGGSTTGPIIVNGRLDIDGSTALTIGTISGSGSTGAIYDESTYSAAGGNTLNFVGGSSFSFFSSAGNNGVINLKITGTGGVSFSDFGYNNNSSNGAPNQTTNFLGGSWSLGQSAKTTPRLRLLVLST